MTEEELNAIIDGLVELMAMPVEPQHVLLPKWVYADAADQTIKYTVIEPEEYWRDT